MKPTEIRDDIFQAYPVLIGDLDASGNLNANILHEVIKGLKCKFVAQVRCFFFCLGNRRSP